MTQEEMYSPIRPEGPAEEKPSLFALTAEMEALDLALTESEGEVTGQIAEQLSRLEAELPRKVDAIAWWWRTLRARITAYQDTEEDFRAKRKTEERKLDELRAYLLACCDRAGQAVLKGRLDQIAVQQNGGLQPLVIHEPYLNDPTQLPGSCQRVRIEADTDAIRSLLASAKITTLRDMDGWAMPGDGAPVIAELQPRGRHVRLR